MDPPAQDPAEKEEDAFILTKLVEGYPELVRSSWSPVARVPDPESNKRLASKFNGNKPFRQDNFVWPRCGSCQDKMSFVCQINLESVPSRMQELIQMTSGLFQLFYCFDCKPRSCFDGLVFVKIEELKPTLMTLAAQALGQAASKDPILHSAIIIENLPQRVREFIEAQTECGPVVFIRKEGGVDLKLMEAQIVEWKENDSKEFPHFSELWEKKELNRMSQDEVQRLDSPTIRSTDCFTS